MDTAQWVLEMRRKLHQCPELGNQEYETTRIIESALGDMGIETARLLETGVVGVLAGTKVPSGEYAAYSGGKPRVLAFRADIDALEIKEATGLPFASAKEGFMHACGHDAHSAILLAVARELSMRRSEFSDIVKFIFQPAEESTGGAERLIALGCMKDPEVDYVFGLHVMPQIPAGSIGIKYGTMYAASDMIRITVHGKSGHGAFPEKSIDAVVAASAIVTNMQSIVSRNVSPANPAVITFGSIHGGTASNIIADKVEIKGTIRTLEPENRKHVKKRVVEMLDGMAAAMGATAEIEFVRGYNAVINDPEAVKMVEDAAVEIAGKDHVVETPNAYMGGEDFSFYLDHAKGAFFGLGCGYRDRENPVLHSELFNIDEACLQTGVSILTSLVR